MSSGKFRNKTKSNRSKGDHNVKECDHVLNGKYIHHKPKNAHEGKKMIVFYDDVGDHKLFVPDRNPCEMPGIIPMTEFERLKRQANVLTKEDRRRLLDETEQKKFRQQEESQRRKDLFEKAQLPQKCQPGSILAVIEEEAAQKNAHTLQRANELRQEQEEDMRKANSIVLTTKCMAIRDAQLQEKKIINEEIQEEEKRLEAMMEQQRQISIRKELERLEKEKEKQQSFVDGVREQMKENEIARMLEAERAEEETRMNARALAELKKEDEEKERQKQEDIKRAQEEMRETNLNSLRYKQIRQEEERIADMRVQNFMKMKAEREDEYLADMELIKLAKEREISRLRAMQQQFRDQKSDMEEMYYRKEIEKVNKEWREKEKLAAQKRKEQVDELNRDREKQIEDLRKAQALEIIREEAESRKVGILQRELFDQEKQKVEKRKEAANQLRKDLLLQINDKEKERIALQRQKCKEGEAQRIEFELRDLKLKESVQKKVEGLKDMNLPERYIQDVYRQINMMKK